MCNFASEKVFRSNEIEITLKKYFLLPILLLLHIVLVYVMYALARIVYVLENGSVFDGLLSDNSLGDIVVGSLYFDTSAILYTNALVVLMTLLPWSLRWKKKVMPWVYVVINGVALSMNLADSVYFRYTGKRTTMSVLQEFSNENNLGSIFGTELVTHWYLVLTGVIMIAVMWYASRRMWIKVETSGYAGLTWNWRAIVTNVLSLLIFVPFCIAGMRGGFTTAVRPITISNANQYVKHPQQAAVVLNTPFSLIRTYGKANFKDPKYFTEEELNALYSPVHQPDTASANYGLLRGYNVVILIVESFGREYIGALNKDLDGGKYKGYTPEMDRIIEKSLTFDYTLCNGRKSIDGMPSILSSIPMFVEPFFLTPASMNDVSGIAGELGKTGYTSAFFHGAENGSMGFQAFANKTGFQRYYGRTEYNEDKRFNGDEDFDGTWAIWDEPFLQFYAMKMTEMKQPFVTAVFTASSHHPFNIPEKYKGVYKDDGPNTLHKCIRYTDHALGEFFRMAEKQTWFKNTIFVLTSDHTNGVDHPEYGTDLGQYCGPVVIYDPSGKIEPCRNPGIMQQIDIMPTLLNLLGYDKPYVAFGKDALNTEPEAAWAVNYNNGIYQYIKGDYMLQFDGQKLVAAYNYRQDALLKNNLLASSQQNDDLKQYEKELKSIIQSYMQRMETDRLTIK